ncbi:MAG TPA: hypothetical protein VJM33_11825 [Microthrixaceae bacterium]|nr:hypothetical protein [Microthrixaceae bacterium]
MNKSNLVGRAAVLAAALVFVALASACAPPPTGGGGQQDPPPQSTVDQTFLASSLNPGAPVVQYCTADGSGFRWRVAQTFTAGRSGSLDMVSLTPKRVSGAPSALSLSIRPVDATGVPNSTVLGTGTFDGTINPGPALTDMALSSPATVVAGTKYALVVEQTCATAGPDGGWALFGQNAGYAGGSVWERAVHPTLSTAWFEPTGIVSDLNFATWVA